MDLENMQDSSEYMLRARCLWDIQRERSGRGRLELREGPRWREIGDLLARGCHKAMGGCRVAQGEGVV